MTDQPDFRFNPRAYDHSFERSAVDCEACDEPAVWAYSGNIYGISTPETICARCIAGDGLSTLMGEEGYSLHDVEIDELPGDVALEFDCHTPGIACYNPFEWPVQDGLPFAFIGYGDEAVIYKDTACQAAMTAAFAKLGMPPVEGSSPYALVFRSLTTKEVRAVVDLD